MKRFSRHQQIGLTLAIVSVATVSSGYLLRSTQPKAPRGHVYTANGYGGYVLPASANPAPNGILQPVVEAYQAGHYTEVETLAAQITRDYPGKREAALAQRLHAYALARRGELSAARERFLELRDMAAALPDRGAMPPQPGEKLPTLEEEGAFQSIVCTSGLGEKATAEADYREFLRRYPQSVLVHASVKRLARGNKGNVPKDAELLWKEAMQVQRRLEEAQRRDEAMCGPELVAELLRREGKRLSVATLAKEMQTTGEGTSLEALASALKKRGFSPRGLEVTEAGLAKQSLPLIALLSPGHYVLVEERTGAEVRVWDPDAAGQGKGGIRTYTPQAFAAAWGGIIMTLR